MARYFRILRLRMCQLQEEGAEPIFDLAPSLYAYYDKHIADGTFVSWIALCGDEIISTSGISFVEKTPITVILPAKSAYYQVCTL